MIRSGKKIAIWAFLGSALVVFNMSPSAPIEPAAANSVSDLSQVAQEAFADLTTCLTSGQNKTIDVFYLVDDSDSLLNTDPELVREEILSDSIVQLASFADQGIAVNVGAALFSSAVTPVFDWQPVDSLDDASQSADNLAKAIRASASSTAGVKWTNWEAGLNYAADELKIQNADGTHCQALIWFTDGGIRLGDDKLLSIPSLANLCHSGISASNLTRTGDSTLGLMSELKKRNVAVFAVLFNNEEALRQVWQSRGSNPSEVDQLVGEFRYFASFMLPLVEGSGTIYGDYTPPGFPNGGYLECADLSPNGTALAGESNGAFLDAQDPISLAFQFLKLQAQISGGDSKIIGVDGRFEIQPGTAAFRILTTSSDWKLTGPEGKVRAAPTSPQPLVDVSDRTGVTTILIPIREEIDLGEWIFEPTEEESISSLFVYAGLTLALDRDRETPIVLGRDNSLGGTIVRQPQFSDLPLDLTVYDENSLMLEIIKDGKLTVVSDVEVVGPDATSGSFRIDGFNPDTAAGDELQVQLTLTLGGDFQPIKSRFSLKVLSSGAFPLLEDSVVRLSSLEGPSGAAQGTMRVVPPTEVDAGEFCIARVAKRVSDPQENAIEPIDRLSSWQWSFEAEGVLVDSGDTACFSVGQSSEPFLITVTARNVSQADSSVESVHAVSSGAVGANPVFGEDVVFEFESATQQSTAVFLLVFIALLILGILLPLVLLYGLNRLTSRFVWANGMVRAEFPVMVGLGFTANLTDSRTGAPLAVGPQDFQFLPDRKNPSSVEDEPHGYPVARVPLFPLSATWTEWVANMGHRVVSIYPGAQKAPGRFSDGKVAEISPVMAENWALIFSEADLGNPAGADNIPATLVVYSEMGDLAKYQARFLNISALPDLVDRIKQVQAGVRQEMPSSDSSSADSLSSSGIMGGSGGPIASGGDPPPPSIHLPGVSPPTA